MPPTSFIDEGVTKNGSTNIGMEERMEGIPSIDFLPLQKVYSNVRLFATIPSISGA